MDNACNEENFLCVLTKRIKNRRRFAISHNGFSSLWINPSVGLSDVFDAVQTKRDRLSRVKNIDNYCYNINVRRDKKNIYYEK